jgi:hypothetical protein
LLQKEYEKRNSTGKFENLQEVTALILMGVESEIILKTD